VVRQPRMRASCRARRRAPAWRARRLPPPPHARRLAHAAAADLGPWAVPPPPRPSLPVYAEPETRFPVGRIFCVGRNYRRALRAARPRLTLALPPRSARPPAAPPRPLGPRGCPARG
jgi:hypothetical protein